MPILAEMRSLTEDLAHSHEERMAGLMARQEEVQNALQETRQRMAEHYADRLEATAALRQNLVEDKALRRAATRSVLASFGRSRKQLATNQALALAKANVDRQFDVQGQRARTQRSIREVHSARVAGEATLKTELRQGRAELSHGISHLMDEIHQARTEMGIRQREALDQGRVQLLTDTSNFLSAARTAHLAMAKAQRETLETGHTALEAEVSATLGGFRASREALARDLAQFSQVWRGFTDERQGRRIGATPGSAYQQAEASLVPSEVATEAATSEQAPAEARGAPTDGTIFSYLADHPDGVRLIELEAHFGTARIRLAQNLNRLIEANKARKDEDRKLYFAI